jgi:hypothetical protein
LHSPHPVPKILYRNTLQRFPSYLQTEEKKNKHESQDVADMRDLVIIIIIMNTVPSSTNRCWSATPQRPCWISRFWVNFSESPSVLNTS